MKGLSIWIEFLVLTAIILAGIIVALQFIQPAYSRFRESTILNDGIRNLQLLDSQIATMVREGGGARKFSISIAGGEYLIDGSKDSIEFLMEGESQIMRPGLSIKQGKLNIITGSEASAYENSSHLVLENNFLKVALKRVSDSFFEILDEVVIKEKGMVLDPTNSSIIFNSNPSLSVTSINSSLVRAGEKLSKAEAIFNSSKFTVIFTLPSNSDYLYVRTIGDLNFSFNALFHLGSWSSDDEIYVPGIRKGNISAFASGCWNKGDIPRYYICSNDLETLPEAMASLIYTGDRPLFEQLCFSNLTAADYNLNLTSASHRAIMAFSVEECGVLDSVVKVNFEQAVPTSIAELPPSEERRYEIAIFREYDAIDIANTVALRRGVRNVCIRYVAIIDGRPSIEISPC